MLRQKRAGQKNGLSHSGFFLHVPSCGLRLLPNLLKMRLALLGVIFVSFLTLSSTAALWPASSASVKRQLGQGEFKEAASALCRLSSSERLAIILEFKDAPPEIFEKALDCIFSTSNLVISWDIRAPEHARALALFRSLLASESSVERATALRVIQPPLIQGLMTELRRLVSSGTKNERVLLASTLGRALKVGRTRTIESLFIRLLDDESVVVRRAALFNLSIRPLPALGPSLLQLLRTGPPSLMGLAALELAVLGNPNFELPLINALSQAPRSEIPALGKAVALYGTDAALDALLLRLEREFNRTQLPSAQETIPAKLLEKLGNFQEDTHLQKRANFVQKVPPAWLAFYVRKQFEGAKGLNLRLSIAFQKQLLDCVAPAQGAASFSYQAEACLSEALRLGANPEPYLPLVRAGHVNSTLYFNSMNKAESQTTLLYALEVLQEPSKQTAIKSAALQLLLRSSPLPVAMLSEMRAYLKSSGLPLTQLSQALRVFLSAPSALRQELIQRYAHSTPERLQRDVLSLRIVELNSVKEWELMLGRLADESLLSSSLSIIDLSGQPKTRKLFLNILVQGSRFREPVIAALRKGYDRLSALRGPKLSPGELKLMANLAKNAPLPERDIWRSRYFTLLIHQGKSPSSNELLQLIGPPERLPKNDRALLSQYSKDIPALTQWLVSSVDKFVPNSEKEIKSQNSEKPVLSWSDYQNLGPHARRKQQEKLSDSALLQALLFEKIPALRFRAAVFLSDVRERKLTKEFKQVYRHCALFEPLASLKLYCRQQLADRKLAAKAVNYIYRTERKVPLALFPVSILTRTGELKPGRSDRQGRLRLGVDELTSFSVSQKN